MIFSQVDIFGYYEGELDGVKLSNSTYNLEIIPVDIREVIPFKTGFFSNNGLNIVKKDGDELNFKIKDRDTWCKLVNQMY